MHDHLKPTVRGFNPDHIILHYRTNDLISKRTATQIVRSIIELALSLKYQDNNVSISLIVPRNANLNNKASEVNIPYIDRTNSIQPENLLNESKSRFNRYETIVFPNSIYKFLSEYYWRYHDSSNIDHLHQESFNKESKSCLQLLDKENHKIASNPSKTIVLNGTEFENKESFLLNESTSSILTHMLNLEHYSKI